MLELCLGLAAIVLLIASPYLVCVALVLVAVKAS